MSDIREDVNMLDSKTHFIFFNEHLKKCSGNSLGGGHKWIGYEWIPEHRVWIETCRYCGYQRLFDSRNIIIIVPDGYTYFDLVSNKDMRRIAQSLELLKMYPKQKKEPKE